jgi:hypothetical protein
MGYIRTFVESDIPEVARLHRTIFKTEDSTDPAWLDSYYTYFTRVFLENPSQDTLLPSLVYEEDAEGVVGFLGVVPRRMTMNGRRVQAAIGSQFVVAQTGHAGHISLQLAEAFLRGPQDLSICDEATDLSRKIWEGLGGTTSLLHSLYWTRPLRPGRLALSLLRDRPRLVPLAVAAKPLARLVDEIATRVPQNHLFELGSDLSAGDDLIESVLTCLPTLVGARSLRVDYDAPTFRWLLERARQKKGSGSLHAAVVKDGDRIVGWYVYHLERDQIATVLQVAAETDAVRTVLDQLFWQAGHHGAIAVTGRAEPRYLQDLSESYCLFHRRGPWVLLNARQQALLRSFETGDAWFSRLDGEWCLGF